MRGFRRLFAVAAFSAALPYASLANDADSLAGLRMECDTCHGVNGVSPTPDQTPSLAGKSERYLIQQLQAFRSGKREHETMLIMGSKLSDAEMRELAHYYAGIKR
jgi:cytochrome c553